jgi:hypothetical protein
MSILRQTVTDATLITLGLVAVIVGWMIFMEGLKVGLMLFGESPGASLPSKATLPTVIAVVFLSACTSPRN